jgi:hypothetical protein
MIRIIFCVSETPHRFLKIPDLGAHRLLKTKRYKSVTGSICSAPGARKNGQISLSGGFTGWEMNPAGDDVLSA